ncbi:MAG: YaiO family outer membrane beta-barrel protein [Gammaproteobacteria bacterium]
MIQQRRFWLTTSLLLLSIDASAATTDACYTEAGIAVENKNFEQAESLLQTHLQHAAEEPASRFLLARVLSWQKKWTQAMALLNTLLEESPNNADYLLARANTLDWMGRGNEALLDLEHARAIAPGYSALWRTEIRLLLDIDTPQSRSQASTLVEAAEQQFPAEDWDMLPDPAETEVHTESNRTNRYAVEAAIGHDELTNNRAPWESRSLVWLVQTPEKHYAHLQFDSFERFDLDDRQFGASYALPIAASWTFYAGVNYSPTHEVIANRMLETRISKNISAGLNLHAGISHARYTSTNSQQFILSGEYYWSDYRAAYTYRLIDVMNAGTGYNHNVQINHYYAAANFIGASVATGDDVEFDGTPDPPISNVLTVSLYGRHMFQPQWSLTWSVALHQQGDFYDRNGFVLGIKFDY